MEMKTFEIGLNALLRSQIVSTIIILIIYLHIIFFHILASYAGEFRKARFSSLPPGKEWKTSSPKNAWVGGYNETGRCNKARA